MPKRESGLSLSHLSVLGLVVLLGFAGWSESSPTAHAQPPESPSASATVRSGVVTAAHGTTLEIDKKPYEVSPTALIKDERGNELELAAINQVMPGTPVKYILRKGRIEELELTLAR